MEVLMKLYWSPQTRAFRAVWMLEGDGIPYERVRIDIRNNGQANPEFRRVNPMAKVPALSDGEAMVAESAAICAYVAERCPQAGLAPAVGDPARGRYLHWLFFASGCIEAAFTQKMLRFELDPITAGWASFDRVIDGIAAAVQPGPWLLGQQFTAADVMIGCDMWYAINLMKILPPKPAIEAYVKRCEARPAFQRALKIDAD